MNQCISNLFSCANGKFPSNSYAFSENVNGMLLDDF